MWCTVQAEYHPDCTGDGRESSTEASEHSSQAFPHSDLPHDAIKRLYLAEFEWSKPNDRCWTFNDFTWKALTLDSAQGEPQSGPDPHFEANFFFDCIR